MVVSTVPGTVAAHHDPESKPVCEIAGPSAATLGAGVSFQPRASTQWLGPVDSSGGPEGGSGLATPAGIGARLFGSVDGSWGVCSPNIPRVCTGQCSVPS